MTKAILFDFNGTMLFDEKFQEISWRSFIAGKIGREVTDEEFQNYVHGRNNEFTLGYFLGGPFTDQEIAELSEEKEIIYRNLCLTSEEFHLALGLPEFLDDLKRHDVPMNIATASGWKNVKFFFDELNLYRWFDLGKVIYDNGHIPGKPEPDLYLLAAQQLEIPIEACAVFEDSRSGLESARRAGANKIVRVASMAKTEQTQQEITLSITDYQNLKAEDIIEFE